MQNSLLSTTNCSNNGILSRYFEKYAKGNSVYCVIIRSNNLKVTS